jgi:Tol biopolymer transport system component
MDRNGREEPIGVPPRAYTSPRIAPDGTRVAVAIDGDIWISELARPGTLLRVTSDPARERFPLWTPDGERILFESNASGTPALLSRTADGRGEASAVLTGRAEDWDLVSPEAWSADGQELLFVYRPPGKNFNIGVLSLGSGQWRPLLDTEATESNVVVSRDGRWIAYEADDTGEVEVYVERYPMLGGRQIVTTGGGKNPFWSPDGRELLYRRGVGADGAMMASAVRSGQALTLEPGREIFGSDFYYPLIGSRSWDVARDGRFLMMRSVEPDAAARAQLVLIKNWAEELRRLVPVQ